LVGSGYDESAAGTLLSFADLSDGLRNWLAGWVGCDLGR
jgi:hypothetical protein